MSRLDTAALTLALTGPAAGVLGIHDEVDPYLSQAREFVSQQQKAEVKPAILPSKNPAASPVVPGNVTQATAAAAALHPDALPAWVKMIGYGVLGLLGLYVGSRIVKG